VWSANLKSGGPVRLAPFFAALRVVVFWCGSRGFCLLIGHEFLGKLPAPGVAESA
jgi:hypothetical protein